MEQAGKCQTGLISGGETILGHSLIVKVVTTKEKYSFFSVKAAWFPVKTRRLSFHIVHLTYMAFIFSTWKSKIKNTSMYTNNFLFTRWKKIKFYWFKKDTDADIVLI